MGIWPWILSGFGIAVLALILLQASGTVIENNDIAAFIAFTCAALLIGIKRVVIGTQQHSN